jgi:myo-inositol 2-dehydrogenase / D-chiro-inositol 1-dehydrogenase
VSRAALRIALVGLGDIAVRAHLPALAREPRATLVAVADLEEERLAAAPGGARPTTDVASVLRDPEIDAVVVATPPAATAGLVRDALDAGKWVLAEKPLGLSIAEMADVRAAPGAAERLQIGLTYRHHPAVDRLRELIADGALGRPLLIQAALCDEPANPDQDPRAYARRLRSLERIPPVVSDGVHACDRINYLLGEPPIDVTGWSLRTDPTYARANVNGGVLTYDDGTVARLDVIWLTPVLPRSQFVVIGPKGLATLEPATFRLTVEFADGTTENHEPPGDKTEVCFALQLERFVDAVLAGRPPVPGLDEAIASLELAERIARAAGVGGPIPESSVPA